MTTLRLTTSLLAATATLAQLAVPANANANAPSATALVEVRETDAQGKITTRRLATTLTLDQRPAAVEMTADRSRFELEIAWTSPGRGAKEPILRLDLGWFEEGRAALRLGATAQVPRRKRVQLGGAVRPDGSRVDVALTLLDPGSSLLRPPPN